MQPFQRLYPGSREYKLIPPRPYVAPHALQKQGLNIFFVVNHQNFVSPIRHSFSPAQRPGKLGLYG